MPTLVASGLAASTAMPNPWTITLPSAYTTNAGDCIVVAYSFSDNFGAPVFSGAGATWINGAPLQADSFPVAGMSIGWGCSAGNTTISVNYHALEIVALAIGVWQGVVAAASPLISSFTNTSGGLNVTSLTTGTLTYTPGVLLLSAGSSQSGGNPVASWSNGLGNTNIAAGNDGSSFEFVSLDMGSSASGTTTDVVTTAPSSRLRNVIVALGTLATAQQVMIV